MTNTELQQHPELAKHARAIVAVPLPLKVIIQLSPNALRLAVAIWEQMLALNTQRRIVKTNKRMANLAHITVGTLLFTQLELHRQNAFWIERDERDPTRSFENGSTAYRMTPKMVKFMVRERRQTREAEKKIGWGGGSFSLELIGT